MPFSSINVYIWVQSYELVSKKPNLFELFRTRGTKSEAQSYELVSKKPNLFELFRTRGTKSEAQSYELVSNNANKSPYLLPI